MNGEEYIFRIADFDHDDLNPTDARYNDSSYNGGKKKAAITFEMVEIFETTYGMNSTNTNSGGWDGSSMRSTTMQTMMGFMPTELKNALRTVSKLASAGARSSEIKTSADQLFLLSEIELVGATSSSAAGEGSQYAYYKAGNSCLKIKAGATSASAWWLRSPNSVSADTFACVTATESVMFLSANAGIGVSFAFCI